MKLTKHAEITQSIADLKKKVLAVKHPKEYIIYKFKPDSPKLKPSEQRLLEELKLKKLKQKKKIQSFRFPIRKSAESTPCLSPVLRNNIISNKDFVSQNKEINGNIWKARLEKLKSKMRLEKIALEKPNEILESVKISPNTLLTKYNKKLKISTYRTSEGPKTDRSNKPSSYIEELPKVNLIKYSRAKSKGRNHTTRFSMGTYDLPSIFH